MQKFILQQSPFENSALHPYRLRRKAVPLQLLLLFLRDRLRLGHGGAFPQRPLMVIDESATLELITQRLPNDSRLAILELPS